MPEVFFLDTFMQRICKHLMPNDNQILLNIPWYALSGPHLAFAVSAPGVKRYGPGFPPIVGFEHPEQPDLDALSSIVDEGETVYIAGTRKIEDARWEILSEVPLHQLVWNGGQVACASDASIRLLGPEHAGSIAALVELCQPGPFGERMLEMGDFYGIIADGELIAMASTRMCAGPYREISSVCTHPAHSGQGLARKLVLHHVALCQNDGNLPFLHVEDSNRRAAGLYLHMGFTPFALPMLYVAKKK